MNVALEDTEEWANGRLTAKYGDTFLRGNNGAFTPRGCGWRVDSFTNHAVLYISALEDL